MKGWSIANAAFLTGFSLLPCLGCNEAPLKQAPTDAGAPIAGLSAEQAARVVAKVGDRAITLGDFAKALERMDQFDRLKYQSKERRRELLEEMIDVELLATEGRRLGIDKDPEAADALRMILRDALLADARGEPTTPAQMNEKDVRAYYEAHADKFNEPERRRVAAIVMTDKKDAEKVLAEARKIKSPVEWGALFAKHSVTATKQPGGPTPAELAGDLGIVGPMTDARGANPKVPDPIRAAAFKLGAVNEVGAELVNAENRWFIIRLNGITPAHHRTLAEADRSIRVVLVQEKMNERERALEQELRKKFTVEIDDAALAGVKLPPGVEKRLNQPDTEPEADAGVEAEHDGGH